MNRYCNNCGTQIEENTKFCPNCGSKTEEGIKFCGVCGASLISEQTLEAAAEEASNHAEETKEEQPETVNDTAAQTVMSAEAQSAEEIASENAGPHFCPHCGNKLPDGAKFCGVCGNTVAAVPPTPEFESKKASFHAPISSGENAFGQVDLNRKDDISRNPGQVIGDTFKSLFSSVTSFFKDPIKLIPVIILAVLWLTVNLLQAFGVNLMTVKVFSFLTFAEAGMHGGILGALGGIIGKGIFAGAAVSVIRLFTQKKGEKRSFKEIIKGSFGFSLDTLWGFLTGAGAAMLLYLFISGGAMRISFMGGIAASFLTARAALNNGFLKNLLGSFTRSKSPSNPNVQGLIRGLSAGFAASALIGLANSNLILIITGSVLLIGGIVMMILQATGVVKLGKGAQQRL